jgi:hypothetical protein
MTQAQQGSTVLASYAYDDLSRVTGIGRPNSAATSMSYSTTALDSAPAASRSYTANGLNQYASVSGTSFSYDARANLTSDGSRRERTITRQRCEVCAIWAR